MTNRRGVTVKGRSTGGSPHARVYMWEHQSAAFQSLSCQARCLLLELKLLYNGRNNGELFLSVRDAARRLSVGKNLAQQAFVDLQDRGFLRQNVIGAFNLKGGARRGLATSWILTEFPIGEDKGIGSRDFMRWSVPAGETPKKIRRSPVRDEVSSEKGHLVPVAGTPPPKLCLVQGHLEPKTRFDGPRSGDTVKLPVGREENDEATETAAR